MSRDDFSQTAWDWHQQPRRTVADRQTRAWSFAPRAPAASRSRRRADGYEPEIDTAGPTYARPRGAGGLVAGPHGHAPRAWRGGAARGADAGALIDDVRAELGRLRSAWELGRASEAELLHAVEAYARSLREAHEENDALHSRYDQLVVAYHGLAQQLASATAAARDAQVRAARARSDPFAC